MRIEQFLKVPEYDVVVKSEVSEGESLDKLLLLGLLSDV